MSKYRGRHRKPSQTRRNIGRLAVAGVAIGAPITVAASPAFAAGGNDWEAVAQCESGGNWNINTGNGYYGGVQFSQSSWAAVGGTGLPSNASKSEQIQRAEALYAIQGAGAWPVCGKGQGNLQGGGPAQAVSNPAPQQQAQPQQQQAKPKSQSKPKSQTKANSSQRQSAPKAKSSQQQAKPKSQTKAQAKAQTRPSASQNSYQAAAPRTGAYYVVQSGDTLAKIANAQGVAGGWQSLFANNQGVVSNPNLIFPGEKLAL